MSTLKPFGFVSIGPSPPSVVIKTMNDKQAQLITVIQYPYVMSINDIKLTLHSTFNIPRGEDDIGVGVKPMINFFKVFY